MQVSHVNGLVAFEIADDSPLALQIRTRDLKAAADERFAAAPQYAGHFDGYGLVRITKPARYKGGSNLLPGEIKLGKRATDTREIAELGDGWNVFDEVGGWNLFLALDSAEAVTA